MYKDIFIRHMVIAGVVFLLFMSCSFYVIASGYRDKSNNAENRLSEAEKVNGELIKQSEELNGIILDEINNSRRIGDEVAMGYEERLKYFEDKTAELERRVDELDRIKADMSSKISSTLEAFGDEADSEMVLSAVYDMEAAEAFAPGYSQGSGSDPLYRVDMLINKLDTEIAVNESVYESMLGRVLASAANEEGVRLALELGVRRENIPTAKPASGRITSVFGNRNNPFGGAVREGHNGVDIALETGTPVTAAGGGEVKYAGEMGSYGYLVVIDHGGGLESYYGHNSAFAVERGQQVRRGQVVSYSGNTGRSTGPHLHFEIRRNNMAVDPMGFIKI